MEGFKYKKLGKEDLEEALALVRRVFMEFEAPVYEEEGVQIFQTFTEYGSILQKVEAGELDFWGCFYKGGITGVIAFRDCLKHISLLFVQKEYHRKGIARGLLETALAYARQKQDMDAITVNSSPYAVKIYERLGFAATQAQQLKDGIIFTPMRKKL